MPWINFGILIPPSSRPPSAIVGHVDHVVEVAGIDHVGLGSDFDGISVPPHQLADVAAFPYFTQALLDRGCSAEDCLKILGGNALRVLSEVEAVARGTAVR